MSDYLECADCGANEFMSEWDRVECKNGHGRGMLPPWPDWKAKAEAAEQASAALRLELTGCEAALDMEREHLKIAEQANAELVEKQSRILTAALRYESRHDADPERRKLWQDLKDAICLAASPAQDATEKQ